MPALPSGPRRPGRLKLTPIRSPHSTRLDGERTPLVKASGRGNNPLPAYMEWGYFYNMFARDFEPGQHITLVGGTGSGKTTLARHAILLRRHIAVAATKVKDKSLYEPLRKEGFYEVDVFNPDWEDMPRQIVNPRLADVSAASRQAQRDVFADMFNSIWQTGGPCCVFADEVRYLTDNLKLATEVETLWLQGRSLEVSLVCGTQRPVGIPLEAFSQASHLFLFRENDQRNIDRMAEFVAGDKDVAKYTIPRLPRYEVLYIRRETGLMARTKVTSR